MKDSSSLDHEKNVLTYLIHKRVLAGRILLNRENPNWRKTVNRKDVDFNKAKDILFIVYGDSTYALGVLGLTKNEAIEYGFFIPIFINPKLIEFYCETLNKEWHSSLE